jgi:hypothetical protein
LGILPLLGLMATAAAQTASPDTPPPRFPEAAPFDARTAPASARQQASMVPIGAGEYPIGAPSNHPLADRAAMPAHRVAINAFKIDRTEVTNEQFAEFLNALPVKPLGVAEGGKVGSDNIPREGHAIFLEFSSRPSPYTMIDLDDAEALIGVRGGRFAPNAGYDHHPVIGRARLRIAAGAAPECRRRFRGRLRHAAAMAECFPGATPRLRRNWQSLIGRAETSCPSAVGRAVRHQKACSTWRGACSNGRARWLAPIPTEPTTDGKISSRRARGPCVAATMSSTMHPRA